MEKRDIDFLRDLTQAPSPSGFETAAARVMRARLEGIADRIETDVLGSVHAVLKGKGKGPSVLIAGHIDEVGLMAKYISDDGFISFYAIGGVDEGILPGLRVDVHTESGPLRGIIGRMPIHLLESDQKKKATPLDKLYIDCGLSGKKAKEIIKIGDPITFSSGFEEFGDGFAVSRAFDDKLGVWIASRVLEEVKLQGGAMGDLIAAGTAQEEIGLRGGTASAFSLDPTIGISAEVGHATDYPDADKRKHGEAKCGAGPLIARGPNINPIVYRQLVQAAEKAGVAFQIEPSPGRTGTDADPFQISRGGKAAGLVSIPLRYMHTPIEVLKLSDLEGAVALLTRFVLDLDEESAFVPM